MESIPTASAQIKAGLASKVVLVRQWIRKALRSRVSQSAHVGSGGRPSKDLYGRIVG